MKSRWSFSVAMTILGSNVMICMNSTYVSIPLHTSLQSLLLTLSSTGTETWKEISVFGDKPSVRFHCSGVVYKASLYLFGGNPASNDIYEFRFCKFLSLRLLWFTFPSSQNHSNQHVVLNQNSGRITSTSMGSSSNSNRRRIDVCGWRFQWCARIWAPLCI